MCVFHVHFLWIQVLEIRSGLHSELGTEFCLHAHFRLHFPFCTFSYNGCVVLYYFKNSHKAAPAHQCHQSWRDLFRKMWEKGPDRRKKTKKEYKATVMIAIVIGTFCLCWFPHSIGVFCIIDPNCNWDDSFFVATTWLAMLNSAMNSIIYGLMNRSFRRAFKSVLCCERYVGNEDLATNIQQERITGDRKSNLLNRYSQHQ